MNDFVTAADTIAAARHAGLQKARLSPPQMVLRGVLAGMLLGYATSLVMVILAQGAPPVVGALCFPVGFVILVLLGLELVTGNFALLPLALLEPRDGRTRDLSPGAMLRNWIWVYAGNLIGSVLYAVLLYLAISSAGASTGGAVGDQLRRAAQAKTLGYAALGAQGWATAVVKGVLCNWMVTLAAVLAFASRSTSGRIAAMWLPIFTFFAHGYEHSVVNMFVIPAGMLLGAPVPPAAWWIWNQIPVTVGNLFGGVLFTALALHLAFPAGTAAETPATREAPGVHAVAQADAV
jgi:formate transporter